MGRDVPGDQVEAIRWYHLATNQGYEIAQYNLGYCYFSGVGVPVDLVEAVRLYHLAADHKIVNNNSKT